MKKLEILSIYCLTEKSFRELLLQKSMNCKILFYMNII